MSKFKVGEVCIYVGLSDQYSKYNGTECVIIKDLGLVSHSTGVSQSYSTQGQDNESTGQSFEKCLKKLPPKDTPSTFEELKDIWIPKGVEA